MRHVLVDVNVVLDVLLDRRPYVAAAAALWAALEKGAARGSLAAHAVTTIYYLISREHGRVTARDSVGALLSVFGVAPVDEHVLQLALGASAPDFEDAVSAAAAQLAGCEAIVTRDPRGFHGSPLPVMAAQAALAWLTIESAPT